MNSTFHLDSEKELVLSLQEKELEHCLEPELEVVQERLLLYDLNMSIYGIKE